MILAKPVCTEEAPKEGKHYEDQLEGKNQKSAVDRSGVGRCRSPYFDLLRPDGGRYDNLGSGVGRSGESDK